MAFTLNARALPGPSHCFRSIFCVTLRVTQKIVELTGLEQLSLGVWESWFDGGLCGLTRCFEPQWLIA